MGCGDPIVCENCHQQGPLEGGALVREVHPEGKVGICGVHLYQAYESQDSCSPLRVQPAGKCYHEYWKQLRTQQMH